MNFHGQSLVTTKNLHSDTSEIISCSMRSLDALLFKATRLGHHHKIKHLLADGANHNACYEFLNDAHFRSGESVLNCAVRHRQIKSIEILIDHGVDVNSSHTAPFFIPVIEAVAQNQLAILQLLLKKGANIQAIDDRGRTLIARACLFYQNDRESLLDFLLKQKKIDINKQDACGQTAIMTMLDRLIVLNKWDRMHDCQLAIQKLLDHGANLNIPDIQGNTPLLMTCVKCPPEFLLFLLNCGTDINAKNKLDQSIFDHLKDRSMFDKIKMIESFVEQQQLNKTISAAPNNTAALPF